MSEISDSQIFSAGNPEELFEIQEKLGEGTYGETFKAMHKETKQLCILERNCFGDVSEVSKVKQVIHNLKQRNNPRFVKIIGAWKLSSLDIWVATELCENGSILNIYEFTKDGLSEQQLSFVLRCVLEGLIYLHSTNKIYKGIYANNISVNSDGDVRLGNFDFEMQTSQAINPTKSESLSVYYNAPEMVVEETYDSKIDIWSLGITTIEMLDGEPPHSDTEPEKVSDLIKDNPPPKPEKPEKWSQELLDFIGKCLIKDPKKRSSAKDLIDHPFIKKYKSIKPDVLLSHSNEQIDGLKIVTDAQFKQAIKIDEKPTSKVQSKVQSKSQSKLPAKTDKADQTNTPQKIETKTISKSETKTPVKVAAKVPIKSDSKTSLKSETKIAPKTETKPSVKVETKIAAKVLAKVPSKTDVKVAPKVVPKQKKK
ncbi:MAG: putative Serine/threonine-protein kinase [Streblomastix strix]|uniref:Putative Serine/threonine-protein kinase n=1 Tax=Streblomastix strix TaxID=222440 RepID=A0A5J4WZ97_9EUKA|nr:MAG: putative Serine/threonine-protein kinase [Streblomastix strix]